MTDETRIHPETGKLLSRSVGPMTVKYGTDSIVVEQPGWWPEDSADEDGIFVGKDNAVWSDALDTLKRAHPDLATARKKGARR